AVPSPGGSASTPERSVRWTDTPRASWNWCLRRLRGKTHHRGARQMLERFGAPRHPGPRRTRPPTTLDGGWAQHQLRTRPRLTLIFLEDPEPQEGGQGAVDGGLGSRRDGEQLGHGPILVRLREELRLPGLEFELGEVEDGIGRRDQTVL